MPRPVRRSTRLGRSARVITILRPAIAFIAIGRACDRARAAAAISAARWSSGRATASIRWRVPSALLRKPLSAAPSACAPTGSEQPAAELGEERSLGLDRPPGGFVVDRRQHVDAVSASSARHSTATQPWPTAGTNASGGRARAAIRRSGRGSRSAATAITIAPPSGTLPSRVWMLPRSSTNWRSGRATRELGAPAHRTGGDRRARAAGRRARSPTSASAALAARQNAASVKPVGGRRRQVLGRVHGDVGVAARAPRAAPP